MSAPAFIFATGIESSIPTIGGGTTRIDQMAQCGHYRHWRTDFALVQQMGISFLRYGPPLHTSFAGPGRYDWDFADATFAELRRRDIVPIADLCHFGVPDWIGNFQNPDFPDLFAQMMDNGMGGDEYAFFMRNDLKPHCIMGTDYYRANEHHVNVDGSTVPAGDVFGYCVIARQYYDRYRLPIMHTETNLAEHAAVDWLQRHWLSVRDLHGGGIPVLGFTWYSLTDQIDWDTALCGQNNRVNALGLFDLARRMRPVGGPTAG